MEHIGLTREQREGRRLTRQAYGVGPKRNVRAHRQSRDEENNLILEKLTQRKHTHQELKDICNKYEEINFEVRRLKAIKFELETKNSQLQTAIQNNIACIHQFQTNSQKQKYIEQIKTLEQNLKDKQSQIQKLTCQISRQKNQKMQTPLESTLEELSVIHPSSNLYETEFKLYELIGECSELRKEIENQSSILMAYQQKLLAEKMEKAEMMFVIEQKQKLIENLMKDRQSVLKQSCSYALSYSMVDDMNNHEEKSCISRQSPFSH